MATITRENIGLLHDKLTVHVSPNDYKVQYETALKKQAAKVNIPGFRKGMVPIGVLKQKFGAKVLYDEIIKLVEKEIEDHIKKEQLDIFFQPLPLSNSLSKLDLINLGEHEFSFEIGIKPTISFEASEINVTRYVINITENILQNEIEKLRSQYGNLVDIESVLSDEDRLNITFKELNSNGEKLEGGIEKATSMLVKHFAPDFRKKLFGLTVDSTIDINLESDFEEVEREQVLGELGIEKSDSSSVNKLFKIIITKIAELQKAVLEETLFNKIYPEKDIDKIEAFRAAVKEEITNYFAVESSKQMHDQIYHCLLELMNIDLPKNFLLHTLEVMGEKRRTKEEAIADYGAFEYQMKWSLIVSYVQKKENLKVYTEDFKQLAKVQLYQYLGGQVAAYGNEFVENYVDKMSKDKNFVDENYSRIITSKIFAALEKQVIAKEEAIDINDFNSKLHHHHY